MSAARDPGETYLGLSLANDPFAVLGLPRAPVDDASVLRALGQRMAEIASHARSQTPEANEVRLALHAAAAQLLDPHVQALLLEQARPSAPAPPRPQSPAAPVPATNSLAYATPEDVEEIEISPLAHDALLVVAAEGGWNPSALRRLAILAHARGVPSADLPAIIASIFAAPLPRPVHEPLAAAPESAYESEGTRVGSIVLGTPAPSREKRSIGATIVPWVIGSITVLSLALVWVRLTSPPKHTPREADPVEQQITPPQTSGNSPAQQNPATPAPSPALGARGAAREITRLAQDRSLPADQLITIFTEAHRALAANWTELGSDQIGAVHQAILEMVYQNTQDTNNSLRIVAAIASPLAAPPASPDELRAWVWSVGTLSRLSVERNLPVSVDSAVVGHLASAMGDAVRSSERGFPEAVLAALARMASAQSASSASEPVWRAWLDMLGAVADPGEAPHIAAVLDATETVMRTGPDPGQSRATYQAIEILCSAMKLEPKSDVAERLIAWLADDQISIADLGVAMRTLIARSRIEGVDESLVLSPGSGEARRLEVRSALEERLLGRNPEAASAVKAWLEIADQQLARSAGASASETLARAVALSRLSAAARATLWGDHDAARDHLANLTGDLDRLVASPPSGSNDSLGGENASEWALKYLDAKQNIPIRQALLSELTRGKRTLGPVAAEVIVREAFLGTPASVRAQAREVVLLHADSPAILSAMLEYLPRMPKIPSTSELIESVAYTRLPAEDSPAWSIRARQAVVEELLRRISGVGEGQVIDLLVPMMQESYADRLGGSSAPGALSADAEALERAAERLAQQWRRLAEQEAEDFELLNMLEELDHRTVGRMLLAEGSLDRFSAHQASGVEAMGILVMAESPSQRQETLTILRRLADDRRTARTILVQILVSERASVELWKLRLRRAAT